MILGERIQQFHKSVLGDFNSNITQFSACHQSMVVTLVVHSTKTHIKVEITGSEEGSKIFCSFSVQVPNIHVLILPVVVVGGGGVVHGCVSI